MIKEIFKGVSLFVDGRGLVAELEGVTPPTIAVKTEDFDAGTLSVKSIDMLGVEPMTMSFKTSSFSSEIQSLLSKNISFQVKGFLQNENGDDKAFAMTCRGMIKQVNVGELKSHAKQTTEFETSNLNYCKLEVASNLVYEIDVDNHIRNIGGQDSLTNYRNALGI